MGFQLPGPDIAVQFGGVFRQGSVSRCESVVLAAKPSRSADSGPSAGRRDGAQIADDLHTLQQESNETGPYVLAGHSFGGLYTQIFADHYPDDVAGMVLIDSTAPATSGTSANTDSGSPDSLIGRASALHSASARIGLARFALTFDYGDLPTNARREIQALGSTADSAHGFLDEFIRANTSRQQAGKLDDFGGKPLVVLTAGSGSSPGWFADQDGLATLSANSAHRTIEGATHPDLIMVEQDATATAQAILDVITSVRTGKQLTP